MRMTRSQLAALIDHTQLGPDVSRAQIRRLCEEAVQYGFYAVCVNPCHVSLAKGLLKDSVVKVTTVVGFPHGANVPAAKAFEAKQAIADGADELDMVPNIAALKESDEGYVLSEIQAVREAARMSTQPVVLKVILETALLNDEQKIAGCKLAKAAGADFVKTSTGFAAGGATVEDVRLLRAAVGPRMGVKASGGIRDYATAVAMIEAGATRIGTSSGVQILEGAPS